MEKWTLTWTKAIPLDRANVCKIPDNIAGVYRLSYKAENDNLYIFYVGQTVDLRTRVLQHLPDTETNEKIKYYLAKSCYFRYAQISKEYIRSAAERQMYRQYEPSCNDREPQGREDVRVNLT